MSDSRQMRYDLEMAARALRGSSWPGEMAQRMEEAAARIDGYADRVEELEAERDEIPHTVLATASWNPTVVLQYLVDTGVLVKCYAVPDSPHVARGRFSWGLFANPGDRGKEDVVELWERVDTLPPLIGEETEEGGCDE